jgi:hypothetical protein
MMTNSLAALFKTQFFPAARDGSSIEDFPGEHSSFASR